MPHRILLCDFTDASTTPALEEELKNAGFEVRRACDTENTMQNLSGASYDMAIVRTDALENAKNLLRALKQAHPDLFIVISHPYKASEEEELSVFDIGVDDCISETGKIRQSYIPRIRAVFSRATRAWTSVSPPANPNIFSIGDMSWNKQKHELYVGTRSIHLTYNQKNILSDLLKNAGQIRTSGELLQSLKNPEDINEQAIPHHIKRIREKLRTAGINAREAIKNISREGYSASNNPDMWRVDKKALHLRRRENPASLEA